MVANEVLNRRYAPIGTAGNHAGLQVHPPSTERRSAFDFGIRNERGPGCDRGL
ncbi:hypothetical protein MPS_1772 [Mycobacterium pseudoshottsii JCM 15466]|uniref:Uncharacterized protein n=1 Tax=Mycobacterium ulcerans str. Harvey TaxID=1299332 RepID=A0ABP3A6K9_MYCUL|nr:hypothetical protein I551_7188 [Mycobacterium ulcerans str. Harvey]GAQ33684.1 hypothetical protein MPS_1772 [Mycobacterium pseudoshottsii JCM 15466]